MAEEIARKSLTSSVSEYLDAPIEYAPVAGLIETDTESVLSISNAEGLSLEEYVAKNPTKAIKQAEASLLEWTRIQGNAAITGVIKTSEGEVHLSKNNTKLIELRVQQATEQLKMVNEYAYTAYRDGEQRREHLIRTLYRRATEKGDTRALIYLMDRVEGRPTEARLSDVEKTAMADIYMIICTLFDKQMEVLNAGNGTILVCCSRRSGKTHMLCATMLIEALRIPNTTVIYIGETMEQSEILVDSGMQQIIGTCGLKDKKGNRLNWKRLDNGSRILVRGLSNTKDPDQIRGHKAKVIVIDEFFHLKSTLLEYLQREVLQPMQMDYAADYKFICTGTPPSIKGTFGEHAWKEWEVPHFFWTYKDNPHPLDVSLRDEYVENVLKEKGLDWTSSFARREYGGEWIYDDDLLLYPDYHTYDVHEGIPQFHIDMVLMGIDYGVSDSDSLIGIAWDSTAERGYEFFESKFNRLTVTDRTISQLEYLRGEIIRAWKQALEFFPTMNLEDANNRVLWDADDNNQHVTDDFNMNCRLPNPGSESDLRLNIRNAHKTDKVMMFDKIRDRLRKADILLIKDGKAADECDKTILQRGPGGQVYPEVDMKTFHPDLLPAMRYALYNVIGMK